MSGPISTEDVDRPPRRRRRIRLAPRRTGPWLASVALDAVALGGAAALCYGASLLHPAAGWITGGALAMVAALRLARRAP